MRNPISGHTSFQSWAGLLLTEITTRAAQGFVAHLAGGGRLRKTAENVLLTLSSLLRTARDHGYVCGDFRFAALTLPREGVEKEPRCFTDDEVRRIIDNAPEPLSTIVAVAAVLGLRVGETLALRKSDVDFAKQTASHIGNSDRPDFPLRCFCVVSSEVTGGDRQ